MLFVLPEDYKENKRSIAKINEKAFIYNKQNRFKDKTIFIPILINNGKPILSINKILIPDNWRYKKFRLKLEIVEDKREIQNALQI